MSDASPASSDTGHKFSYNPAEIEPKWQKIWAEKNAFVTPQTPDLSKPKYYILDMFPYPSGAGLHVGHPKGYTATDVIARLKRMQGFNVLHPMGWDAFGLPAERAAVRENIHPAVITQRNINTFRGQIQRLGFSYDWTREIDTSHIDYYKWTQWIFLRLQEKGLAYLADIPVNWCPAVCTVLANEEVKDGVYVETGDPVERRVMRQWMLKITAYAERLLNDLDLVDWPESIKEMQRHWIGKSTGARVRFTIQNSTDLFFDVFTTRPDTLFGATYAVLAPEHPLVSTIVTADKKDEVDAYIVKAKTKSDLARTDLAKEKTGVFTGAYAINPVNQQPIPIWVADYVLMSYGSGAIMAVPGHDRRDHDFATAFGLPIIEVIHQDGEDVQKMAYTGDGYLVNSQFLDNLDVPAAQAKIISWLEQKRCGEAQVTYKLRDWLFSRQRYWGEPFPIVHTADGEVVALTNDLLPVPLPPVDQYKPTEDGNPPLGRASSDWREITLPDGRKALRELNTMPQWAGSCWYYLRFIDPKNATAPFDPNLEKYWLSVDLYIGGVEHAVLHLLYARFWHKVLYDCGLVHSPEPFQKLFNQGMVLSYSYQDKRGKYYPLDDVVEEDDKIYSRSTGEPLTKKIDKMSKSRLNVVNPDDVIRDVGADSLRLYELFMGPLSASGPWQTQGVEGIYRFLQRSWRLVVDENSGELSAKLSDSDPASQPELLRLLHKTIRQVEEDTLAINRMNTAISQLMVFVNAATGVSELPKDIVKTFLRCLAPYAPHIAEELWQRLGESGLVSLEAWPVYDPALCRDSEVELAVQINGKVKAKLTVASDASEDCIRHAALALPEIASSLIGKIPQQIRVVPGRLVVIVAK